jgi:dipeptidyl aminopeptidase/acylaminoacyl peptidase
MVADEVVIAVGAERGRPLMNTDRRLAAALAVLLWVGVGRHAAADDRFLIYPQTPPEGVVTWASSHRVNDLLVHLQWARPPGQGPFPVVLVHPEAGRTAEDMLGVLHDLAGRGYFAAAADYRRLIGSRFRRTLFPWREPGDSTAALAIVLKNTYADSDRVAALGFSEGGSLSLVLASQSGILKAVAAYYPITDLPRWLDDPEYGAGRRLIFSLVRRYYFNQSGASSEKEFQQILRRDSPLFHADTIVVPVQLVHGTADTSAPIDESRRLAARLVGLGRPVELVEVAGAGHVFNFNDATRAVTPWRRTVAFLDRCLREIPPPSH